MDTIMDISNPAKTVKCWVELYSDKMYTWAFYKTSNKEIAEDLVQDTFLVAFQSIQKFEGKSDPKTWLFGILNNKIADHFRKVYRNPIITESERLDNNNFSWLNNFFDEDGNWKKNQRPSEWSEEKGNLLDDLEFKKVLENCMEKLPANWNATLQLKFLEEKNSEHICQELQITPTNFWQMLHRAKLQLRKCLEIHWFKK